MRYGVLTYEVGEVIKTHSLARFWKDSFEDVLYDDPGCYIATEYLPGGGWVAHGEYHFCGCDDLVVL